jgi:hypothetical protein
MAEIGLAHLVRAQNGLTPFQTFLASYRAHEGGAAHDLIIIFKGFAAQADAAPYRAQLAGLSYRELFVPDEGFDIGPYFTAARQFDHQYFCFLNSFSVLLADDWLARLHEHMLRPGVGVVGATGSYESPYTYYLRQWRERRRHLTGRSRQRLADEYYGWLDLLRRRIHFHPFPNYHIRTNAFMLPRQVINRLKVGSLRRKEDVARFESGRRGLTRQVFAMNLAALVVGRDRRAYEPKEWCASRTFRNDDQSNLLVADNRTQQYAQANPASRRLLAEFAWGTHGAII